MTTKLVTASDFLKEMSDRSIISPELAKIISEGTLFDGTIEMNPGMANLIKNALLEAKKGGMGIYMTALNIINALK